MTSTEDIYQTMIRCHDKLVATLSANYLCVAETLLANNLIPEEIFAKMLLLSSTPHEKASILVTSVRERIKVTPKRFHDFLSILSKQAWTKDIVEILLSHYQGIVFIRSI